MPLGSQAHEPPPSLRSATKYFNELVPLHPLKGFRQAALGGQAQGIYQIRNKSRTLLVLPASNDTRDSKLGFSQMLC